LEIGILLVYLLRDLNNQFDEWGLEDFEIKRIAVTKEQVRDLKLYKAKGPKTLEKLLRDSRHKTFMAENDGELFQTECDAITKAAGLKELMRIIEEDIIQKYWDQETWDKYKDVFTPEKVHKRLVKAMGELATEELGNSDIEDAIDEALEDLHTEEEELREIEGEDYQEPINEEDFEVPEDEEDIELE
jgi:hypothetical protein